MEELFDRYLWTLNCNVAALANDLWRKSRTLRTAMATTVANAPSWSALCGSHRGLVEPGGFLRRQIQTRLMKCGSADASNPAPDAAKSVRTVFRNVASLMPI